MKAGAGSVVKYLHGGDSLKFETLMVTLSFYKLMAHYSVYNGLALVPIL
jgi:hypothetical protein